LGKSGGKRRIRGKAEEKTLGKFMRTKKKGLYSKKASIKKRGRKSILKDHVKKRGKRNVERHEGGNLQLKKGSQISGGGASRFGIHDKKKLKTQGDDTREENNNLMKKKQSPFAKNGTIT